MSDDLEPVNPQTVLPISHRRILVIMAVLGLFGSIAGFAFVSANFGLGVLIGSIFAFVNYYWLKASLKTIFDRTGQGEKPKLFALRYFARYLGLGVVIAVIYATESVSIVAFILGMAGFGFAVVVDGFIRIVIGVFSEKAH